MSDLLHEINIDVNYGEKGYIKLLNYIAYCGYPKKSRAGNTYSIFDSKLIFSDHFPPIFKSRKINYKYSFDEFWFFLNGKTQTKELEEKGINFWKGNTSREFLDNRGLNHLEAGDMGKAYGYQFRKYQDHIDQLKQVYELLKNDTGTRRAYVTFWNPAQEHEMALPPCWHSHQFVIEDNYLNLKLINRSLDILYGAPFAVFQYWVYLNAMAKLLNLKVGKMACDLSDIHIYDNQLNYVYEYLDHCAELDSKNLITNEIPKIEIKKELNTLDDMLNMTFEDIEFFNFEQYGFKPISKKPPMAV